MRETDVVWIVLRTLICLSLVGLGSTMILMKQEIILGYLISATGVLAILTPFLIKKGERK